jgi:hypothetical protein
MPRPTGSRSSSKVAGVPRSTRISFFVRRFPSTDPKRKLPDGWPQRTHHLTCRGTQSTSGTPMPRRGCPSTAPSTGCARSTATNPGTTNCAPKPAITVALPCTPTLRTIQGCSSDQHTRHRSWCQRNHHTRGESRSRKRRPLAALAMVALGPTRAGRGLTTQLLATLSPEPVRPSSGSGVGLEDGHRVRSRRRRPMSRETPAYTSWTRSIIAGSIRREAAGGPASTGRAPRSKTSRLTSAFACSSSPQTKVLGVSPRVVEEIAVVERFGERGDRRNDARAGERALRPPRRRSYRSRRRGPRDRPRVP